MNLVGYTTTALSRNDIIDTPTNKNVVDGAIVELKDYDGNLVTIYDDINGTNPETQKTCDTNGQCTFFAEAGDYVLEVNGRPQNITISVNITVVNDVSSQRIWGDRYKGELTDDVGVTLADEFSVLLYDGNYYSYTGSDPFPVIVASGTVPTAPDYKLRNPTDHDSDINRNAAGAHNADAISTLDGNVQEDINLIKESPYSSLERGDILKKVKDKTTIRGMYFRKQSSTDFRVGIGMGGVSDAIVEYRFYKNDDGLILLRGGYSGRENPSLYLDNSTVLTGAFNQGSAPETYTTEVGAKVNGSFSGDCFHFISRKDNRGGLWKLTLTNSFGFVREANISTYSDTTESPVTQKVFENLDFGDYSYELEFMGDDPNNPPSTTARGWIYYRPDQDQYPVRFLTVAPLVEVGKKDILSTNSIPDFAIKARVSPNTSNTEWVPQHGSVSGVSSSQLIKIILDGVEVSATNTIPDINYRKIKHFELIQSFDAVNPLEPSTTLWEHYVSHSISTTSPYCSIANRCEFVSDTYCAQIYFAMLPSDADNADRLVLSQGLEIDSIPTDGSEINFNQESESAMYSGLYSASITHAAICRVNGLKDSLNWGTEYQEDNSGRTTFRADGITKCYWNAGAGVTVPAGTVMKSNHDLMVVTGGRSPDNLFKTI